MSKPPSVRLKIGLLVNPIAGLGGALALKGSDELGDAALPRDGREALPSRSMERASRALSALRLLDREVDFFCWDGSMGGSVLEALGFGATVIGSASHSHTTAGDSCEAVCSFVAAGADIIVFAGGDGTARDVYDAVGDKFPVLGIPAGVKMHSGVFAVSPEAAGELLVELVRGGLVSLAPREVRDIDERAFRQNVVRSRYYGEMLVPDHARFLQHTKIGGVENAELAAADIAAWVVESMNDGIYIIGPGSTTAAIMEELGLDNTLLGVDVVGGGQLLLSDATEADLLRFLADQKGSARIIVTAIGGQGHIFGRGNQQISPAVIRTVGTASIDVVAAKSKIAALQGRPLLVDTNDAALDRELCGYRPVITGYQDQVLYRVATIA